MRISFNEEKRIFDIRTENSTYQMAVHKSGHLVHNYYGSTIHGDVGISTIDFGMNATPYYVCGDKKYYRPNLACQEYSVYGTGDYRSSCLHAVFADGSQAADLKYESHRIFEGKPSLSGLPATYFDNGEVTTLEITLKDCVKDLRVVLLYSVADGFDAVIRSSRIVNNTGEPVYLESALTGCLDFTDGDRDFVTFGGRPLDERVFTRHPLKQGKVSVESNRGISSHNANPFSILCSKNTDETTGECYGMSLLYSGNFVASAELDEARQTRVVMGINPTGFRFKLENNDEFQAPEMVLCYSNEGFGKMSRCYHKLYREHLCRGYYKDHRRPVLINSWEAFIFDFTSEDLVGLAKNSADCGIEMLVLDDGWFGERNNDDCSLGDWFANEEKLGGTLGELAERINEQGLKFGLWFEPEMVSKRSKLFENHPDWWLCCPDREPVVGRSQYVLDMSRKDVRDYLFDTISAVLSSANIEYVKWDMNRPLSDVYSAVLPADRQGEVYHRYVLGLYELMERLLTAFPKVLFEGCASGGGRFDAGMLYYTPQIWCSDNSEASERTYIQYNSSFGYPMSCISAHVSPCPNHQTGRTTPMKTRGVVGMTGSFGYELDIGILSDDEKKQICEQVAFYKEHYDLLSKGEYYRLTNPYESNTVAWAFVSEDKTQALTGVFTRKYIANPAPYRVRLAGLDPKALYSVTVDGEKIEEALSGDLLINAGIAFTFPTKDSEKADYGAFFIELKKV